MDGLPKAGDVVADKFRIESVCGEGGMGIVYRAHHVILDQRIALKVLFGDAATRETSVERFAREAQAAARISCRHVTRVLDAGALEDGRPFIAMELLEGENLETRLARVVGEGEQGLPIDETCDFMMQALIALGHAHAAGIVHRDIKPPNLFVCNDADGSQILKVLDFGISKSARSERRDKVLTGHSVLGSPAYMSPEQLRNASNIDARADLWSVGTVFYEMLTGKIPFDAESVGEIFAAILEKDPVNVRTLRPDIPEELADVIMFALRRDRDERFATAIEFAHALSPFVSSRFRDTPSQLERVFSASGITVEPSIRSLRAVARSGPASSGKPDSRPDLAGAAVAVRNSGSPNAISRGAFVTAAVALGIALVASIGAFSRNPPAAAGAVERTALREEYLAPTLEETPLTVTDEIDELDGAGTKSDAASSGHAASGGARLGPAWKAQKTHGRPQFLKSSD